MCLFQTDENLEQYRFFRDACYDTADDGSDRLPSDVVNGLHWIYFGEDEGARECFHHACLSTNS
jgi:hypothetical protein